MIAYKGFTKNLTARLGKGEYQFTPLKKHIDVEESTKTGRNGFHCCENPFNCLSYYSFLSGDRFFKVQAEGNLNEDNDGRIACTEITLIEELTIKQFAGYGMIYILEHPMRQNWEKKYRELEVKKETAKAESAGTIAIARGRNPRVQGAEGSILGIILEPKEGNIEEAKLFVVGNESGTKANTWYTLTKNRELEEIDSEKKNN